ncbi:MAG: DUF1588 domain-containing protein, partial [Planctomycetota bacterium]
WSSMPDDELFELARQKRLTQPLVLKEQVERMLSHPKANELADSFSGQWLSTHLVGHEIRLDPIDNPWCTDSLMDAMRAETRMFFQVAIRDNWPITRWIDSDTTFVNEELAQTLYRMKNVRGKKMKEVSLHGSQRKGILGHASVLAVTSNHDETSPIKRGAYVLERILGTPPPPPPPDAGELEDELIENDRLSMAQKLKRHASSERCSGCHQRIDPIGISLENYGAFGRKRSRIHGRRINVAAKLADGFQLDGVEDLRNYLLHERKDDYVRNVVVRLLEYALGRPTEYFDEPAIRKIIRDAEQDDLRFQTIIQSIVRSYPFQFRQSPK